MDGTLDVGPAVASQDAGSSGVSWMNAGNASTFDSVYATCALSAEDSKRLVLSFYSVGIPTNATITGLAATLVASATGSVQVLNIQVWDDGSGVVGSLNTVETALPAVEGDVPLPVLTPADFGLTSAAIRTLMLSDAFGLALVLNGTGGASVDYVTLRIYYTTPDPSGSAAMRVVTLITQQTL